MVAAEEITVAQGVALKNIAEQAIRAADAAENLPDPLEQGRTETERLADSFADANREFQFIMSSAEEASDKIKESKTQAELLADAVSSIDFSRALTQAEAFSRALGVSLVTARQIMGVLGGGGPALGTEENSVLDPRSPNYMPGLQDSLSNQEQLESIRANLAADAEARASAASGGSGGGGGGGGSAQEWMTMFPRLEEQLNSYNERVEEAERSYTLLDDALDAGIISQDEYLQKMREVEAQYGPLGQELEKVGDMAKDIAGIVGNELSSAFASVIDGSKTVGQALMDFAQNVLMKVAQMLFDKLIVNPLMDALGGALGGISLGAANGAAFTKGGVQAFADGGVVNSPTLFKFANGGKVGLMGEAGAEAILPLSRGSDGKLGVKSQGGGSPVNVVVNNYSNEQADVKQNGQDLEITIGRVISRDIQNGGPTYRAMRKTFGLRQPVTTRG